MHHIFAKKKKSFCCGKNVVVAPLTILLFQIAFFSWLILEWAYLQVSVLT